MYDASVRISEAPASRAKLARVVACCASFAGCGGYAGTGITPARRQPRNAVMKCGPGG
jgi:hypothetical protein